MKLIHLVVLIVGILLTNCRTENNQKNIFTSIYENLFLKYPKVDVKPEDFLNHLNPDSENYQRAIISNAITLIFGLLVYIVPIYLTERYHAGPYPLWLHNFYCAADFMGAWVFLNAYKKYNFYLFAINSIGEGCWVFMEIFCLQRTIKYESELYWKKGTPLSKKITDILIQIIYFFAGLNLLRFELNDVVMLKFWIFTQVLITIVPGLELEKRGYRKGNNLLLHFILICVAFISFNPWCNMWKEIAPEYFSIEYNPWYYIIGFVSFTMSVRGLFIYLRLPEENNDKIKQE